MKLTDKHITFLCSKGYTVNDMPQIQAAINRSKYILIETETDKETRITADKALEILGEETFLSGIGRSAFHWSSAKESADGKYTVSFDSETLFRPSRKGSALIALLILFISIACTRIPMEDFSEIEVTPVHTVYPDLPGFNIHIPSNVRSQKYLFEWYVNGDKQFSEWEYLKSGTNHPVQILVKPGTYSLRVTLDIPSGDGTETVCDKTMTLIYSQTVQVEEYPHAGDLSLEI